MISKKVLNRVLLTLVLPVVMVGGWIFSLSYSAITIDHGYTAHKGQRQSLTLNAAQIDSIERQFGSAIEVLPEYRIPIFTALSYYPDLVGVKITFAYSEESTTMASRPQVMSLFSKQRHYRILVNNKLDFDGILLKDVPAEAQVGIIGHEIAHIVEYEKRNWLGILQIGSMLLTKNGSRTLERATDRHTIEQDWAGNCANGRSTPCTTHRKLQRLIKNSSGKPIWTLTK